MTKGDGAAGPSRGPGAPGAGRNPDPAAQRRQTVRGWGCVTVFALLIVGGIMWSLYDEGVFDSAEEKTAPVFGPREVGRLVERLSAAADAQGVCYGWVIDSGRPYTVRTPVPSYSGTFSPHPPRPAPSEAAQAGVESTPAAPPGPRPAPSGTGGSGPSGTDGPPPAPIGAPGSNPERVDRDLRALDDPGFEFGSNLGAGVDPRQAPEQCPKWMVFHADYNYSTRYNEWTSGRFKIKTNLGRVHEFRYELLLGQFAVDDDIDGPNSGARLRDGIGAMPLLAAHEGLAPPVPAETAQAAPPPADDRISKSYVTARNVWSVIGVMLIAGAVVWVAVAGVRTLRGGGR